MKKLILFLFGVALLGVAVVWAQTSPSNINRGAMVTRISRVEVFSFDTDRPVRGVRVLVDGKRVASDGWQAERTGFKLVVITPPFSEAPFVQIFTEVDNMGGFMKVRYNRRLSAHLREVKLFPETNVTLNGWTQVYRLFQEAVDRPEYDLRIEVSPDLPPPPDEKQ